MTEQSRSPDARLARLRDFLRQDPANWSLRAEVFDAALAAGATDVAEEVLAGALAERAEDLSWRHREATFLLATARYPEARARLEGLLSEGPDHPVVRYDLAYSRFAQGEHAEARDLVAPLRDAAEETGVLAWALWLRCSHHLNESDLALRELVERAGNQPLGGDAWGVASLMALDLGRLRDARAWSERALRLREDQTEALATQGYLALAKEAAPEAERWFRQALGRNPKDGRVWSGLALAEMLGGDLPGASEAFEKAVATMPDHAGTWLAWGWCRLLRGDPAGAKETFESALALDRNFGESHGSLAVALAYLGDVAGATRELELAQRLDSAGVSARYARGLLSGELIDPKAIQALARRVLREQRRAAAEGDPADSSGASSPP